ncbi:hypothetical protein [Sphingomonas phyllosphaerae]|uniref:hypothetical protein n=1 Tax=Sphingomonas phyllosphaerae TaxID=257003 RepID=UPI000428A606|nr:hypothetical protein [Sphingomonas phyllosphaerae]
MAPSWLPLASLCSLTLGCATPAASTRFDVALRETDGTCITTFEGRDLTNAELLEIARAKAQKTREAQVATKAADAPWRCVAGLIYTLQMAGFGKVNFAALSSSRR